MLALAETLLFFVALVHGTAMLIQMNYWDWLMRVTGAPRIIRERAPLRRLLGSQGLHNGFIAAGLLWGIFNSDPDLGLQVQFFFGGFVAILGLYNGLNAQSNAPLTLQFLPAFLAIVLIILA
ncbi:MAG: DUF1304 family protein [Myxococcota bacterium]